MAINTAPRRRSAAGVAFFVFGPGITPDATADQFWRQSSAWSYGGILAGSPPAVTAQSPAASRYRGGYRVNYVTRALFLLAWLWR